MNQTISPSRSPLLRGGAAALAERVERFCAAGIDHRAQETCVEPGVSAAKHRRLGHDAGCATLGVPRRAIEIAVRQWDQAGAAALLLEAIDEAIEALTGLSRSGTWQAELARECVAYAIRTRITPAA